MGGLRRNSTTLAKLTMLALVAKVIAICESRTLHALEEEAQPVDDRIAEYVAQVEDELKRLYPCKVDAVIPVSYREIPSQVIGAHTYIVKASLLTGPPISEGPTEFHHVHLYIHWWPCAPGKRTELGQIDNTKTLDSKIEEFDAAKIMSCALDAGGTRVANFEQAELFRPLRGHHSGRLPSRAKSTAGSGAVSRRSRPTEERYGGAHGWVL